MVGVYGTAIVKVYKFTKEVCERNCMLCNMYSYMALRVYIHLEMYWGKKALRRQIHVMKREKKKQNTKDKVS